MDFEEVKKIYSDSLPPYDENGNKRVIVDIKDEIRKLLAQQPKYEANGDLIVMHDIKAILIAETKKNLAIKYDAPNIFAGLHEVSHDNSQKVSKNIQYNEQHPVYQQQTQIMLPSGQQSYSHRPQASYRVSDELFYDENCNLFYNEGKGRVKVSNFIITIDSLIHLLDINGSEKKYFIISLYTDMSFYTQKFKIPLEDYKEFAKKISKNPKFIPFQVCKGQEGHFVDYLIIIFKLRYKNVEELVEYEYCGWSMPQNGNRMWVNPSVDTLQKQRQTGSIIKFRPIVPHNADVKRIAFSGMNFLNICHIEKSLPILLYELTSVSEQLFLDAGHRLNFAIMFEGNSGTHKTSLSVEIFSPFIADKERRKIGAKTATVASIARIVDMYKNDVLGIDDLNCATKNEVALTEELSRVQSDGNARLRVDMTNFKSVSSPKIQGGICITAEQHNASERISSALRRLVITFDQGTIDETVLTFYQNNPSLIPMFISLYIQWLGNRYSQIVAIIRGSYQQILADNRHNMLYPRQSEMKARLKVTAELLVKFLYDIKFINEGQLNNNTHLYHDIIDKIIAEQQINSANKEPHVQFLAILKQLLETNGINLATSKNVYLAPRDIGWFDTGKNIDENLLYVEPSEVFTAVYKKAMETGERLSAGMTEIYGQLKLHDISVCNAGSNLRKTSVNGKRPTMLCLKVDKIGDGING